MRLTSNRKETPVNQPSLPSADGVFLLLIAGLLSLGALCATDDLKQSPSRGGNGTQDTAEPT